MQAIILAAGMGKRLKELTQDRTKCMVQVNGVALIDRMLHQIERRHLSRIVIVVGYEGEKLMEYIDTLGIRTPIVYVHNPIYDKTNNIYSLALAKDYLCQDDTLLFESDLIFEDSVIDQLLDDPRETLALVDKYKSWMDGTCVKLGADDSIESFVPGKSFKFQEAGEYYKTVNIYKFGRHFSQTYYVPFLEAYSKALGNNEYYEQVLRVITMLDDPEIRAKRLSGQLWYEIDDIQDLDIASSMFAQDPDFKVSLMQGRYGGYWRYPQLLDFCYLVNPYFPAGDVRRLIRWAEEKGIRLIVDESFADFADEADNTFIRQELLDAHKRLYVVKSISKSYGVPGLRLGVLASGDTELIDALKKDVAIWNINSFAEFYMQIEEKYKKDYAQSLDRIRAERARFRAELEKLPNLRVIPSQANYLMVELLGGLSSRAVTRELLIGSRILVKDLSAKLGGRQYLRLAVRNTEDNDKLLAALRPLCSQ